MCLAGEIAAVDRFGNVHRLNRHRLDLEALESAISSKRTSVGLPGVTEARARFEIEAEKKTKLWDQRRAENQAQRIAAEKSFARNRTIGRTAKAALREPGEAVSQSLKRGGKGAGIAGRSILGVLAGLLKFFDFAPAKPPTPEQQQRNQLADEQQQATDDIKARQEATDEQRRAHRKIQEQDTRLAATLATSKTIGSGQQQRDRDREIERDLH